MNFPLPGDFIDIHNHDGNSVVGRFSVENIMAYENRVPDLRDGITFTIGIHPWHLSNDSFASQIEKVNLYAGHKNVIAIGEAGFDKLRGPSLEIQKKAFEEQVKIAGEFSKPVYIHCVKAWDELVESHKRLKPSGPWLIHGFRGKIDLANQLLLRGMYLSFWFDFILRPESENLLKNLPLDRIFLETDGSGVDISVIYKKVANDLKMNIEQLNKQIYFNYCEFFRL